MGADGSDAGSPPAWSPSRLAGHSVARLAVTTDRLVLLEETLTGFDQLAPGPRTVHAFDRHGGATGAILAGGSDGWTQNLDGLSILGSGAKLLISVPSALGEPMRVAVPAGPRHNEIRSVEIRPDGAWYAGHEDGPLTHSGDGDPSQIRSTGVVDVASPARQPPGSARRRHTASRRCTRHGVAGA